ncbi:hypothetical protein RND71_006569 [Anisodus tanguticus]|uniref:FRIGIDA-like protein n=1 Tax=Anisodus tanguticus TaxID=243964 RepID=A0AAE1VNS2_9SOLA|nr:hypothetical protein RND71_006569 [Anisodus tanguticus]
MNRMDKPPASASAPPQLATQFIQAEPKQVTGNSSQQKQSELQELPTHIRVSIIANLRKLSDFLSVFQQCLTELQPHIDSSMQLLPPPHTTNTNSLSPPVAAQPEPSQVSNEEEEEDEDEDDVEDRGRSGRGSENPTLFRGDKPLQSNEQSWSKELHARLVLNCLDKFYLQGSSVYVEGSHRIPQRNASILALECLVLMMVDGEGVVEIAKEVKKYAKKAALAWKGRYLVQLGAKGIFGALRRSSVFMEKIPEVIEWRVKSNAAEALDIAYTLAKKNYLFALKSVVICLRRHRIDPSKLLPGWQLDVKLMSLEKEAVELNEHVGQEELAELIKHIRDQKMAQKRKIDETESSGCFSNKEMKYSYFPNPNPWPQHQQKAVNHSNSTLLEGGGTASHIYGYSLSPSVLHAPVAGSIHEKVVGSLPGPVGGVVATDGAGAGKSVQGGSCAGVHGLTLVDSTPGQIGSHTGQLHGRRGDTVVYERLASHRYAYKQSSYLEGSGSTELPNTIIGDAYWPPPYLEASIRLPNTISGDAYKPPPYLEASTGLSNTIPADAYRPPPHLEASTRPPPYLEASMGLPNTIRGDVYKPPPYLEASTGLPNTIPTDAYRAPPYLKTSMGFPNTMSADAYRPPPYLEASTGLPNTMSAEAYRPPSYLEASTELPNTKLADAYRAPPYLKASTGLPNITPDDAYRPPPYLEGSTGFPNAIPNDVAGGSSTSVTYQFADTVPATELYRNSGSRAVDAVPSAVPAHSSSYLYWSR